jgi:hypothetical protein
MRFTLKIVSLLLTFLVFASAQNSTPSQQPELPTFQSKAELVLVPVVVGNKKG